MIERSEQLVTVFGGDGFIGRYVCEYLFKSGVRVRVASRDPRNAYFIQPLGQVGQFGFVQADITNAASVRNAVKGATAVVNLVGVFGRGMHAVHVDGARNVAEAAARRRRRGAGPHLGDRREPDSPVRLRPHQGRRRAGRPRGVSPCATIVRPSLVFGPEDELTNRFAAMARLPILPVIAAKRNFQPVYVRDLAQGDRHGRARPAALWRQDL